MVKKILIFAICLFAVASAVPAARAKMLDAVHPLVQRFRTRLVPGRLEALADQLDARLGLGQGIPQNWEAWLRRDYSGVPEDPWGNLYYLNTRRRGYYTVGSMGPDGKQNTDDDIKVEREMGN